MIWFWRILAFFLISLNLLGFALYEIVEREDTLYAVGYSDLKFSQITCGSSHENVLKALGEPLWKNKLKVSSDLRVDETWGYSKQKDSTANFKQRLIEYDPSGRVVRFTCDYYVD